MSDKAIIFIAIYAFISAGAFCVAKSMDRDDTWGALAMVFFWPLVVLALLAGCSIEFTKRGK